MTDRACGDCLHLHDERDLVELANHVRVCQRCADARLGLRDHEEKADG